MNIQSQLEEALENLPIATAGEDSMEASLLAQANALLLLFKHLSRSALHETGPSAERLLRLAVRAQAESGRIMQRLIGLKKDSRRRAASASQDEAHRNDATVI